MTALKKIAILSDTHGLLRPEVKSLLAGADVILHAGDLDSQEVADTLNSFGQTYIVRGNNDGPWAQALPRSLAFNVEGVRFFMVHNRADLPSPLPKVDVAVFGHSHRYSAERRGGTLWLNPGSCGRRRFRLELTLCMMWAENGRYQLEKIVLPPA